MNRLRIRDFLLLNFVLLVYSIGAIFSKLASVEKFLSPKYFLFYSAVLGCLFIYAILWQQVLKKIPLTVAFANKAIVIVWGIIWGMIFFHEKLKITMVIGAVVIMLGIYCVVSDDGE